jgi:hypothetical protein
MIDMCDLLLLATQQQGSGQRKNQAKWRQSRRLRWRTTQLRHAVRASPGERP